MILAWASPFKQHQDLQMVGLKKMAYSNRMTSMVLYSRPTYIVPFTALYTPGIWTVRSPVYMHNLDDNYPIRPGFELQH